MNLYSMLTPNRTTRPLVAVVALKYWILTEYI